MLIAKIHLNFLFVWRGSCRLLSNPLLMISRWLFEILTDIRYEIPQRRMFLSLITRNDRMCCVNGRMNAEADVS